MKAEPFHSCFLLPPVQALIVMMELLFVPECVVLSHHENVESLI